MPVDKVVVVFQLIPESTEFYEVTDPDLIPLLLACNGKFIPIYSDGDPDLDRLDEIMFGENGESRDPRVVSLTKCGPVVIDGSDGVVAIINTGVLL